MTDAGGMLRSRWRGMLLTGVGIYLVPIALYSVVASVTWLVLLRDLPWLGDSADYVEAARQIAGGYGFPDGYYWPPGLPWSVSMAIGRGIDEQLLIRLMMLLFGLAFVGTTAFLARSIIADRRCALFAGVLAATYAPLIMLAGQPFSQVPSAVAAGAGIAGTARWARSRNIGWLVFASLALGCSVLVRPANAVLALVLGATALVAGIRQWQAGMRSWRVPTGLLAGVVAGTLVLVPVVRFNFERTGRLTVSTNNERNFFLGNNPFTHSYRTWHQASRSLDELPPGVAAYLESVYAADDRRTAMLDAARNEIAARPGHFLLRTLNRIRAFWGFDYLGSNLLAAEKGFGAGGRMALVAAEGGGYLLVALLAIVGAAGLRVADGKWPVLLLGSIAAIQFPYVLAFSSGTYHFGAMVPVLVLAGAGVREVARPDRNENVARLPGARLAVIALLLIQLEYAFWVLAAG